ncbi:MAG: hypothetical protein JWN70_5593 [Planctomycetaceae bacterium]|nr:hypothetical protein [Planctomycetaceae bacterium]
MTHEVMPGLFFCVVFLLADQATADFVFRNGLP